MDGRTSAACKPNNRTQNGNFKYPDVRIQSENTERWRVHYNELLKGELDKGR